MGQGNASLVKAVYDVDNQDDNDNQRQTKRHKIILAVIGFYRMLSHVRLISLLVLQ
jgi:hypothetical protein